MDAAAATGDEQARHRHDAVFSAEDASAELADARNQMTFGTL